MENVIGFTKLGISFLASAGAGMMCSGVIAAFVPAPAKLSARIAIKVATYFASSWFSAKMFTYVSQWLQDIEDLIRNVTIPTIKQLLESLRPASA